MREKRVRRKRIGAVFHSLGMILFFIALSALNLRWHNREDLSADENRRLAELPRFNEPGMMSGKFAEDFDSWVTDRFVFRGHFLQVNRIIQEMRGFQTGPRLVRVRSGNLFEADNVLSEQASILGDPGTPPDSGLAAGDQKNLPLNGRMLSLGAQGIRGRAGFLLPGDGLKALFIPGPKVHRPEQPGEQVRTENAILILGNRGFEVVKYSEGSAAYYADAVARFAALTGDDVDSYLIVAPSHLQQIDPELYGGPLGADQRAAIDFIHNRVGGQVKSVDVFPALTNRNAEGIYFRTDHHWTARGAYLAYREFAIKARFIPVPLSRYSVREVPGFLGSMYLLTGNRALAREPDVVELFVPFVEHRYQVQRYGEMVDKPILDDFYADRPNKYEIFISSDRPLAVIKNTVGGGRRIAVVKDSYGNAFIPFLMPHFEEVHIIDPRYFDRNLIQYVAEQQIDDVLFINYLAVVSIARGYARNLHRVIDLPRTP